RDGQMVVIGAEGEMGQGTYTSIPMLIAEELEVDLKNIRLEHAPPNAKLYGNPLLGGIQATGNSNAIRAAWQPLRQAGAVARTMLVSRRSAGTSTPAPVARKTAKCCMRRRDNASNTASLRAMPHACLSPKTLRSSGRRISSLSALRPSGWTLQLRPTERQSTVSMCGRRA